MTQADKKEFLKIIYGLAELFSHKLTEIQVELYFNALSDLPFEDVKRAANIVARTCKFFPKPVEFREQITPNLDAIATLAYAKVEKAFKRAGVYESVVFDDPVIHVVIHNLGGWIKYCNLADEEVKWWRKDFERLYRQYAPMASKLNIPKSLPGLHETHNSANGQKVKPPMIIGDVQKVLEWRGEKKALSA